MKKIEVISLINCIFTRYFCMTNPRFVTQFSCMTGLLCHNSRILGAYINIFGFIACASFYINIRTIINVSRLEILNSCVYRTFVSQILDLWHNFPVFTGLLRQKSGILGATIDFLTIVFFLYRLDMLQKLMSCVHQILLWVMSLFKYFSVFDILEQYVII